MIRGFKMHLYPGCEAEYERRHQQLWPEMKALIHEYGGRNYSIFLDPATHTLFGYIEFDDAARYDESTEQAINRRWWDYMADLMETNPDNSPVSELLPLLFHLD
ncbi:L-rhamnose mutarotase [Oscillospiraceae bacterium HV4-5-C5C]|nr:L-rhamnose mutarotase [Oscillospiraceae bacterium HV4-5-C5C]